MSPDRYHTLRTTGRTFRSAARTVALLFWMGGLYSFFTTIRPLMPDAPENLTWGERRVMGVVALITIGGFGLAGWLAGRLLRASAELIDVFVDGAEAAGRTADLIELQLVPALGRLAVALERPAVGTSPGPGPAPDDEARLQTLAAFRRAIGAGRWGRAERLSRAFVRDFPAAPEAATLPDELSRARQEAIDALRARLDDARRARDPERVIDLRDALTEHLRGEPLKDLDREVVQWLVGEVQARLRSGAARPEVVALAGRVADSFGDTPEGASLHAALPSLRRNAGLCPRCGRPSPGRAEACPRCLAIGAGDAITNTTPEAAQPEPRGPR